MSPRRIAFVLGLGLAFLGVVVTLILALLGEELVQDLPNAARREASAQDAALRREGSAEAVPSGPVLRGEGSAGSTATPLRSDECAIAGRVLHADTHVAIAGVPVHAVSHGAPADVVVRASAVSGADGTYRLRGLDEEAWRVDVVATGGSWVNAEVARGTAPQGTIWTWAAEVEAGREVPHHVYVLPSARLEGTVHDVDGAPVLGAVVSIPFVAGPAGPVWSQPRFPWPAAPSVRTDADGRFVLDGLPWGDRVRCTAQLEGGLAADSEPVSLRPPNPTAVTIRLPHSRSAVVRVVDAKTGDLLEDALVWMRWRGGSLGAQGAETARTDASGSVLLSPLPESPVSLRVEALGHGTYRSTKDEAVDGDAWTLFTAEAKGRYTATVALAPAALLGGRVVLPEGLAPGLVFITLHRAADAPEGAPTLDGYRKRWPVDRAGSFRCTVPPGGLWEVRVHDLYEPWDQGTEETAASGDVDLVLRPARRAPEEDALHDGPVWDLLLVGPGGADLAWARVEISHARWGDYPLLPEDELFAEVEPDQEGPGLRCKVPVSSEHGAIWVKLNGRGDDDVPLAAITRGPLGPEGGAATFEIPRALEIEGRVLDPGGSPAQGLEVEARAPRPEGMPKTWHWWGYRDSAITDANGRFVVRRLDAGTFALTVEEAAGWVSPPPLLVAAGSRDVVLRLLGGMQATITVRDEAGEPIVGARVTVHQRDGLRGPDADYWMESREWIPADAAGRSVLRALESTGVYLLKIEPPRARRDELADVLVLSWKPHDDQVVLPAWRSVSGIVRTPDGRPVDDAIAVLRQVVRPAPRRARTDADGRFTFAKVRPGAVRVGAYLPSLRPPSLADILTQDAVGGADDVVLVLDPGRALRLGLGGLQRQEARVQRLLVTPLDDATSKAPTHRVDVPEDAEAVTVRGLTEGLRYRVWARTPEGGRYVSAIVEPDDDYVVPSLRAGGTIRGTVVLPEGAEGAHVGIIHRGVEIGTFLIDTTEFVLTGVPDGIWPVTFSWTQERERRRVVKPAKAGDVVAFDPQEMR